MADGINTDIEALYEIRNALVRFHSRIVPLQNSADRVFQSIDEQIAVRAKQLLAEIADKKAGAEEELRRLLEASREYEAEREEFSRLFKVFFVSENDNSEGNLATLGRCIGILEQYLGTDISIDTDVRGMPDDSTKTLHLSREEVNTQWIIALNNIDTQISNYKEALLKRGVPDCKWLDDESAVHRARMIEQAGYELDVASGHSNDTVNDGQAYQYPVDYVRFYDDLTAKFTKYCLSGTNPNFDVSPEWKDNCQRCVPTCEARRRGKDVTTRPSTYGSSHLAYHPFDAWNNAQVIYCQDSGQKEIEASMKSWGDGIRVQVVVYWDNPLGGGHTFLAEQINGHTVFSDPQTGRTDVSDYFSRVIPGTTRFCRIDNLEFSPYHVDCWEEVPTHGL